MPQTVPMGVGGADYSTSFDYSTFQFDLSLLSDDYGATYSPIKTCLVALSPNYLHVSKQSQHQHQQRYQPTSHFQQIKQEVRSPRSGSPSSTGVCPSPTYFVSPNYSRNASPSYPTSPYYVPRSPQSVEINPTSPEPCKSDPASVAGCRKLIKRENSFDLLTILHESRLLAESLGCKEDSTDCTVPCTPPSRTEEDIYNSLDADFFLPKKDESVSLLKEILFKEEPHFSPTSCVSSPGSIRSSSSSIAFSPTPAPILEYEKSSLGERLFRNNLSPSKEPETILTPSSEDTTPAVTISTTTTTPESSSLVVYKQQTSNDQDHEESKCDHQLLREVLRDTSFQRKYNLRPIDLGSIDMNDYVESESSCVGDLASEQIEPVLSLAIQQLQKDFDNTCVTLGIHPEPRRWSTADVAAWLQWARRQLQLPSVSLESFNIDGTALAAFTEEDFCQRAPQCGSMLHAQLEIWKAAVEESPRNILNASWTFMGLGQPSTLGCSSSSNVSSTPGSIKESCNLDYSDDDTDEISPMGQAESNSADNITGGPAGVGGGKIRTSGSHIHLWQFLKELLQCPSIHGSCIRWLDRDKGVFKIEDSVRVARLWGKRKNRPAMNYDKLSRSIRQYYKKGIMKKTERSQRLVYQFCHPYCF